MKLKMIAMIAAVALTSAALTWMLSARGRATADPHAGHDHAEEAHAEHEGIEISGLRIEPAVTGEGWDSVAVTGRVTVPPDRLVKISPRIDGKIVSAVGTVGDSVRRGQVLAVISSLELAEARAAYRQASARLSSARANLSRESQIAKLGATSVRPVEEARSEHLAAQGELSDARSELAQAQSELVREESELVQCKARLERARELFGDKIVSRQDLETAEAEFKRDSAAVESAKSKITQAQSRIAKAQSKVDIARQYVSREEKISRSRVLDLRNLQGARAEIASAEADLRAASDRIRVLGASPGGSGDTLAVRSPISGRIVARSGNIGEMASPADALFTVADLSHVWVEADVYEKDLARVRRGQPVEIIVDAYPNSTFSGKVDSVGDLLSTESRTAKVRCAVSNADGRLRGEMFARVNLLVSKHGRTVLVARDAVLDDAGGKIVFTPCTDCPEDEKAGQSACGSFDKLNVTTGARRGDRIEVLSGIEPGTPIVTAGAYQIQTALGSGKLEAGCTDH